jgi:hypothetical protein
VRQERFGPSLKHGRRSLSLSGGWVERGQVGTIVEQFDDRTLLVEFGDDESRASPVATCPQPERLVRRLVLHDVPEPADAGCMLN